MKLLTRLFITFLALSVIYTGLCFLGPDSFKANKTVQIDAPIQMVFNEIIDLDSWKDWSPWIGRDSSMEIIFGEIKSGIGAVYSWKSENSGNGSLIIDQANYPVQVRSKMEFEEWKGISYSYWDLSIASSQQTELNWRLETDTPISFFVRGIMYLNGSEKKLQEGLDHGIQQIKSVLEEKRASNQAIVQEIIMEDRTFFYMRDVVETDQIESFFSMHLGTLATATISKNVEMSGMPCGLYYSWNTATRTTDMAAAIPVEEVFDISSGAFITIDGGKVLIVDNFGPYESLHLGHEALQSYLQKNNLEMRSPVIEEYMNDPSLVNDPSEIQTRIYYYLR